MTRQNNHYTNILISLIDMKQIITKMLLCLVVLASALTANAQIKAFDKYADMSNVTYIFISKYMLEDNKTTVPGVDIKTLMNKLSGIQIISTENNAVQKKLRNDVRSIIDRDKYELLMQINEDGRKVNIFHSIQKQQSVVVMLVEAEKETTVMVFSGKFTLDDVTKMTQ